MTAPAFDASRRTDGSTVGNASPRWGRHALSALISHLGVVPFGLYIAIFLAIPTVLALTSGLQDANGAFTLSNFAALGDPTILMTFWNSVWLSALTAIVGVVVGALVCYALLAFSETGVLRSVVDSISSVLAQLGGVVLAFAMIATIGLQGMVTLWLKNTFGFDIFSEGAWIYKLPGLVPAYIYFQVPLMVITFMPALQALKPQWLEAVLTLGGSRAVFWRRVGLPVLMQSLLASFLLLFANSFSSYATAAALASQGSQIVPLQIRTALTSETLLGRENLAGVLAFGMIVIVAVVMSLYAWIQRRAARWQR